MVYNFFKLEFFYYGNKLLFKNEVIEDEEENDVYNELPFEEDW